MANLRTDERVPCAIAAMDIVSYSREFDEAQEWLVERLNGLIRSSLDEFGVDDAVCLPTGDGTFIVFVGRTSAVALDFALKVSEIIRDERTTLLLRIGIHEGAVKLVTDVAGKCNVVGTAINVAARVMDVGDGGSIVVSEQAHATLAASQRFAASLTQLAHNPVEVKHGLLLNLYQYCDGSAGLRTDPAKLRHDIGIRSAAIGRNVEWPQLLDTRHELRISDLSMPLFGVPGVLDEMERLIRQGATIGVLLCNPVSGLIELRRVSRAYDAIEELETTLEYVLKILRPFRKRLERTCGVDLASNFDVRLYDSIPAVSAVVTDERAYVSFYLEHLSGSRGPFVTVAGGSPLYDCIVKSLDVLWKERSVSLYDSKLERRLEALRDARKHTLQDLAVPAYLL